jgi:hypothetical protein
MSPTFQLDSQSLVKMHNVNPPPYKPPRAGHQQPTTSVCFQTSRTWSDSSDSFPGRHEPRLGFSTTNKSSLDFMQRVERKLAEYNASENVFKRWLFEMLCWLTSALSMGAIIGIYMSLANKPMSKVGYLLTLTNALGKIASAALIVPTSEALGQLKWNWFNKSRAMWDFEIFDKASRYGFLTRYIFGHTLMS